MQLGKDMIPSKRLFLQSVMHRRLSKSAGRMLLGLVFLVTFFVNNHVIYPDLMEARNIIAAREMLEDGHWLVPTLNGELRVEKPPLPTWIAAGVEAVCPGSIASQRAAAGLAAVMLAYFFCRFARRVLRLPPVVPVLLLCTSYSIILMGRTASWDIYCHAFMMGCIYFLARALQAEGAGWRYFAAAGVMMGLSVLSKGPVSPYALLLPCVLSAVWTVRPTMRGKWGGAGLMILTALVAGGWWYAYIWLNVGDAAVQVAAKESGSWINHNVRPWWYYWKFFLETGVWAVLTLTAVSLPFFQKKLRANRGYMFSLAWAAATIVLLSALPEKKPRYLLPLLIPLAYTMGFLVTGWAQAFAKNAASAADKSLFRLNCLLIATAVILLPPFAYVFVYLRGFIPLGMWAAWTAFCGIISIWLVRCAVKWKPAGMVYAVTVLFCVAECFMMPCLNGIINNLDMHSIAAVRKMEALRPLPFYHNSEEALRIEMVYETGKKIRPLDIGCIDSVRAHVPFALLTHKPASEEMPADVAAAFRLQPIDRYDNNRRPKGNRRYSADFIYYVTVVGGN